MQIVPYLTFDGECEAAFRFYAEALGGEIIMLSTFDQMPSAEPYPPEVARRISHVRLRVGGQLLMGSDGPPDRPHPGISGVWVSLSVDDPNEADRRFAALADGATITMPIAPSFWATRFGMLVDRYGVAWMINCERPAPAATAAATDTQSALG